MKKIIIIFALAYPLSSITNDYNLEKENRKRGIYRGVSLFDAINDCDIQEVERLLNAGVNVNASDRAASNETPLWYAAKNGCTDLVKLLLARGAHTRPAARPGRVNSPLHAAVMAENEDQALPIVNILLHAGADVRARDAWGQTPLYTLSQINLHVKYALPVAFRLLMAGADPYKGDYFGDTPLDFAALKRNYPLMTLFSSYPGHTLQEQIIFSLARNYYGDNLAEKAQAEEEIRLILSGKLGIFNSNHITMLSLITGIQPGTND